MGVARAALGDVRGARRGVTRSRAPPLELAPDETKVAVTCADGVRVFETKGW